jgi:hypothetical protein
MKAFYKNSILLIIATGLSFLVGVLNNRNYPDAYTIFNALLSFVLTAFLIFVSYKNKVLSIATLIYGMSIFGGIFYLSIIQSLVNAEKYDIINGLYEKILLSPLCGFSAIWGDTYFEMRLFLNFVFCMLLIPSILMGSSVMFITKKTYLKNKKV